MINARRTAAAAGTLLAASAALAAPPLVFIPNAGQTDGAVLFHVKSAGPEAFFTREGVVYREAPDANGRGSVVRMRVEGMQGGVRVEPREPLGGRANFFLGRDPAGWRAGIPTWGGLEYVDALPGIDWLWSGAEGTLKSDLIVAPGVDPASITLLIEGAECVTIDADGALRIATLQGEIVERPPVAFQRGRSEGPVSARFVMRGRDSVGFEIGPRDAQSELVIDPVVDFATFLGGSGQDGVTAVADQRFHGPGTHFYIASGRTRSPDFPTAIGPFLTPFGSWDAFAIEMDLETSSILTSTFYGGSGDDAAVGVRVYPHGIHDLIGNTTSPDLPSAPRTFDRTLDGATDAFFVRWDRSGLIVGSYIGGAGDDEVRAVGAFIVGVTSSPDFPHSLGSPRIGWAGPHDSSFSGPTDGFVVDISIDTPATGLISTYLGGSGDDAVNATGAQYDGSAWVGGETTSLDFPTSASAHDGALSGSRDAFVSMFTDNLSNLGPSTYLGGSGSESVTGVSVSDAAHVKVAGWTDSADFPLVEPLAPGLAGGRDAFLSRLTADAASLLFSTPVGGSLDDGPIVRLTNFLGHPTVVTTTASPDVVLKDPIQSSLAGSTDVLMATINLDSIPPRLEWSSYLGGTEAEIVHWAEADRNDCVMLGGTTHSADFPVNRAIQPAIASGEDGFVARICESDILGRRDPEDVLPEIQDQLDRIEDTLAACDCAAMQAALAALQASAAAAAADHALMQDALDDMSRRIDELLALVMALGREPLEREIERALFERDCVPWLWLPAAQDGKLEIALALIERRIDAAIASGSGGVNESVARARLANAVAESTDGDYQRACRSLADAIHALTTP